MSRPTVSSAARSHIGSVRTINEDRILNDEHRCLWAVADGMGGHSRGDMAAQLVVSALARIDRGAPLTACMIEIALGSANEEIVALNDRMGSQSGATVAGLFIENFAAEIFWAGDSRVYRRRGDKLSLLTRDDRALQDMIEAGVISAEQARKHPRGTVITRAVGATAIFELSYRSEPLQAGDIFLICSDGLSDLVDHDEIEAELSSDIDASAATLVRRALVRGGHDNVSIVIVRVADVARPSSVYAREARECATRF